DDEEPTPKAATSSTERARRRARNRVFDLAYSNDFSYFVTLTLDKEKVDRYDIREITHKLNIWLDNNTRRKGLAYVLVPELHKDGAIHFHGLFNGALSATSSGTWAHGGDKPRRPRSKAEKEAWINDPDYHEVFNLPAWPYGFSTAIPLYGDRGATAGYIVKYITKTVEKIGGRWYFSGGALQGPAVSVTDADYNDFSDGKGGEFEIKELGVKARKLSLF
ncbi:MAG: hypothetical protein IKS78_00540, partial [Clostridia bacterium]|nr:hypothetical protein [Clostridia bacterium]